jgi:hypothetical protein
MSKSMNRVLWVPIQGYEESSAKAEFSSKAGLHRKFTNPPHLDIVDKRIADLYQVCPFTGVVKPFLEMPATSYKSKSSEKQMLIDRGTAVHNMLQQVLSVGSNPLKVVFVSIIICLLISVVKLVVGFISQISRRETAKRAQDCSFTTLYMDQRSATGEIERVFVQVVGVPNTCTYFQPGS